VDDVLRSIGGQGMVESIRTLRSRLRQAPWTKTLPNGQAVTVGEWDLQRRIAESLDTTREIEALRPALATMMAGDYSDLVRWTIPFRAARPLNAMNVAMDCASFASRERLAAIEAQHASSILGSAMNFPLPELCDMAGLPRLSDSFRDPLSTRIPTLLVSGSWDGRTPPINAQQVASTMANATLITIPEASHGLFQEPIAVAALQRFLGTKRTP
jgi:pimeloyl-ACP methyl ester carboxylesterase